MITIIWKLRKLSRGFVNYHLVKEYHDFERAPEVWIKYSRGKQEELINKFFEHIPNPLAYDKPIGAGYKSCSGKNKRRARLPEPVMFTERVVAEEPAAKSP